MPRLLTIAAFLLGLVFVVVCGLIIFAWGSMSIREYPTCTVYTFRLDAAHVDQFKRDTKSTLAALSLRVDGETDDGIGWSNEKSFVTLSAHANADSTAYVCTKQHESAEWQTISNHLEPLLDRYGRIDSAHIQLNPALFECERNACPPVKVRVPVDFMAFNNGTMQLPPRK